MLLWTAYKSKMHVTTFTGMAIYIHVMLTEIIIKTGTTKAQWKWSFADNQQLEMNEK